jgi:adenosylmethionine-8-amino-7-oxononanoate aminotransferase
MSKLARLDHRYVWHPFTQMRDWLAREPIVIVGGQGAVLRDVHGREYLDANASIWTNLHGHNQPRIDAAIRRQLDKIAHSSALGLANEPASLLAERLVKLAKPGLAKVFFSDDGSTAMEVALKLAYEYTWRTGRSQKPRFLSLQGAYHGDTVGAVSLGHIDLFHKSYRGLLFKSDRVMAPYCYRCPFNRAKPERADARAYRQCKWECLDKVAAKFAAQRKRGNPYAGLIVEPLIQGAAGLIPQPEGWLARVAEMARADGALLVADEVMTGFGRTGLDRKEAFRGLESPADQTGAGRSANRNNASGKEFSPSLFACHKEGVRPDLLAVAKGLSGGYLPLAATLTSQVIFDAFLGDYTEFKTFFHGHSFTGNQLASAAALASLELLDSEESRRSRRKLGQVLAEELKSLWEQPRVGDIRQVGLMIGIELVKDWRTREPYPPAERAGIRVCEAMARRGVLTRPVGNVVVLLPPYCTTASQAKRMVAVLREATEEVFQK